MKVFFQKGHEPFKPTKEILCSVCKNSYLPTGFTQLYCPACKKIKSYQWKKKYAQLHREKILINRRKRDRLPTAKARYARYRRTEKYKKYRITCYKNLSENKRKAGYFFRNAVRSGKLIKPNNCEKCGIQEWGVKRSMIEGHHFKGYEPDHWLSIQWLCTTCHKQAHAGEELMPNEVI